MARAATAKPNEETAVVVREATAIERVRDAVESRLGDIEKILPPGMDAARFARVSLLAISKNPDILECDRASIVMAIIEAAEVGLEPTGGVGGAHLVPFREKGGGPKHAQLIYDYRGVQHLIRLGGGGEVKTVLVYKGDHFVVHEGTQPRIDHEPAYQTTNPVDIEYVYAWPLDHPDKFEVMTKAQVDGIRARAKSPNNGPWVTDYGAMGRKTVLKRISAWLPLKPEIRAALERDTEREIAAPPTETAKSRTAEVRERVRARSTRKPATDAPGAAQPAEGQDAASPSASASQQPEPAAEGDVREVCGESSDPKLGAVETCVLAPGHQTADGASQIHQSKDGSVWPAVKP